MNIADVLKHLGFVPGVDFIAQDDGDGPYIASWLSQEAQPTEAELLASELPAAKALKLQELAAYRFAQETGGITVSGIAVATDRESQSLITAARIIAKEDSEYTVNWKGESGFVTLDAATLIAVADAVRAHVQACFDNEKDHVTAINALSTAAEVAAYDIETGW